MYQNFFKTNSRSDHNLYYNAWKSFKFSNGKPNRLFKNMSTVWPSQTAQWIKLLIMVHADLSLVTSSESKIVDR